MVHVHTVKAAERREFSLYMDYMLSSMLEEVRSAVGRIIGPCAGESSKRNLMGDRQHS